MYKPNSVSISKLCFINLVLFFCKNIQATYPKTPDLLVLLLDGTHASFPLWYCFGLGLTYVCSYLLNWWSLTPPFHPYLAKLLKECEFRWNIRGDDMYQNMLLLLRKYKAELV